MIRDMQLEDVDRVYEIENESFFQPWSKKTLIKDLKDNRHLEHYVYLEEGIIIGFYIVSFIMDEAEIFTIAVKKEYRNKFIASKMLEDLINKSRCKNISKIFLEVSTKNENALKLYKKFNFEKVGIRKNYYQLINEDAYIMRKDI